MSSKLSFAFTVLLINSIEWTSVRCGLFDVFTGPALGSDIVPQGAPGLDIVPQGAPGLDIVPQGAPGSDIVPQGAPKSDIVSQRSSDEEQVAETLSECGINSKSEGLVKSVDPSRNHDWPWIVMLLNRLESPLNFCGGVLINKNYILTAAHCMKSKNIEDIYVRLGEYDLNVNFETRHIDVDVAEIKMHKDYSNENYQHDIALLRLAEPIEYTDTILPICLPKPDTRMQTNETAIVAGWGAIFYGGITSDVLLEVSVPLWDYEACQSAYTQTIFDTNICAAGYEGQRDSCVGDSGGPLVIQQSNGRWTNIGIVSWGISCGIKNHPGIYTKVEAYLDWIRNNTRDAVL